jgi:hypothetical protein
VTGKVLKLIPGTLMVMALLFLAGQAQAKDNYCAECHISSEIAAFGNVMKWDRSIFQAKDNTVCPGVLDLKREAYFSESRLVKYDVFLTELEHQARRYPEYMREDLVKQGVKYEDLVSLTPTSIESVTGPNLKIKKSMHEVYEKINKLRGDHKMEYVIGGSLLITLLLMLLFSLGLKNTIKE